MHYVPLHRNLVTYVSERRVYSIDILAYGFVIRADVLSTPVGLTDIFWVQHGIATVPLGQG
jgi:hypothetical protein